MCIILIDSRYAVLDKGKTRIEWCWYQRCKDPSHFLRDKQSAGKRSTFQPSEVDLESWQKNIEAFGDNIRGWIKPSLLHHLELLSKVETYSRKNSVYCDGRVWCVGSANCQILPTLGLGTDVLAYQVLQLPALENEKSADWEQKVRDYGNTLAQASVSELAESTR